ncbi:16S rRNA (guanine(527)-N(7))-methyltransferase RsmG, partial [Francisella tularensis subsp. holarctica]|nr:16S rRNA (guanine(527)-N(7))-methyltransferase RsmG [Francisella tularensis subsp. holarctica]
GRDLEERNLESLPLNIEKYSINVPFLNAERTLIVMRKKL